MNLRFLLQGTEIEIEKVEKNSNLTGCEVSQTPLLYSEGKWRNPREEVAENLKTKIEENLSTHL